MLENLEEFDNDILLQVQLHEFLLDADRYRSVDLLVVKNVTLSVDPQRCLVLIMEEGRATRHKNFYHNVVFF